MTEASSKRLAKDVATELERRRRRRKILILAAIVGLLVLAFLYLRCGAGWGLGGEGKGKGEGKGEGKGLIATTDAGPGRCDLRITKDGITVDEKPATPDEALAACKAAGGAEVVVVGDAMQGVWDDLRVRLEAEHVPMFLQKK